MKLRSFTFVLMLFLGAFASNGQTFEWGAQFGDSAQLHYSQTGLDAAGNVYCWAKFYAPGSIDIDPGPNEYKIPEGSGSFLTKLDHQGNFLWGKEINRGVGYGGYGKFDVDAQGNTYTSGNFLDEMTVDPQTNTMLQGTYTNIYIAKWNSSGTLKWAKNISGLEGPDYIRGSATGGVLMVGRIRKGATIDFDPGPDSSKVTASELSCFVLHLDASGNFESVSIWPFGAGPMPFFDAAGNAYLTGTLRAGVTDSLDMDPGPGVFKLAADPNSVSSFIAKYDASGKFVWAGALKAGYMSSAYISTLNVDPSGNIYVGGRFAKSVDFDPGSSEILLYGDGGGLLTGFVAKLNSNGQGLWAKKLAVEANPNQAACVDAEGNFYTTVRFYGTIDVDPGPGTALIQADPSGSIYMMKLSANGDMAWATQFNGNFASPFFIHVNGSGDIYSSGEMRDKVDFDPGPDSFFMAPIVHEDMYIFKLSQGECDNTILGINNIQDVKCLSDGLISVHAYGGESPYTYTWDSTTNLLNDSVAAPKKEGIYSITVKDNRGCERHSSIMIKGPQMGNLPELNVTLRNSGSMLPGIQSNISLNLTNDVCLESSGTLTLVKDSRVSLLQAVPTPDHISGDSISWNFSKLIYLGVPFNPFLVVKPDTSLQFDDTLNFRVFAYDPQGDLDSTNNERAYRFNVSAPFDPNDLQVNPGGQCSPAYVMKDQKLTYTVRFQNTGNYKATNVYVQDNLSYDLDISTIKILAKSHPQLAIEVLPGNLVNFRFDNINLPDSTNDEPGSHGFFVFEIAPNPDLPENTVIENSVNIYFDFNEPIITNTVKNTFVSNMPSLNVTLSGATLTASDGAYSYQWVDCSNNSEPIPGADQKTFTPTKSGTYAVRVNMKHCDIVSECITIQVTGNGNVFQQETSVYPNPSSGELFIRLDKVHSRVEVKISDMQGRQVLQYVGEGQNFSFNPETIPGIYLVSVRTEEGVAVFKVIRN